MAASLASMRRNPTRTMDYACSPRLVMRQSFLQPSAGSTSSRMTNDATST